MQLKQLREQNVSQQCSITSHSDDHGGQASHQIGRQEQRAERGIPDCAITKAVRTRISWQHRYKQVVGKIRKKEVQ